MRIQALSVLEPAGSRPEKAISVLTRISLTALDRDWHALPASLALHDYACTWFSSLRRGVMAAASGSIDSATADPPPLLPEDLLQTLAALVMVEFFRCRACVRCELEDGVASAAASGRGSERKDGTSRRSSKPSLWLDPIDKDGWVNLSTCSHYHASFIIGGARAIMTGLNSVGLSLQVDPERRRARLVKLKPLTKTSTDPTASSTSSTDGGKPISASGLESVI